MNLVFVHMLEVSTPEQQKEIEVAVLGAQREVTRTRVDERGIPIPRWYSTDVETADAASLTMLQMRSWGGAR